MSLFPAYAANDSDKNDTPVESWQQNSSYISIQYVNTNDFSDRRSAEKREKKKKKFKRQRAKNRINRKMRKHKDDPKSNKAEISREGDESTSSNKSPISDKDFFLDCKSDNRYLELNKTEKSTRPDYKRPCKSLPSVSFAKALLHKKKKEKVLRYFSKKVVRSGQNDSLVGEELSKKVEELNKAVNEDGTKIENWLRLVSFQDQYFKYEAIRYNTPEERNRALNAQKLTILEKAMLKNPQDITLQETWMKIALDYCSYDEVENKLNNLLKTQDSFVLWLGRIFLVQQSMPKSTSPSVIKIYGEAMNRLESSRHLPNISKDSFILELLCYACTYLEQAGLWELSWKVMSLTFYLNLSLEIPSIDVADELIIEQENKILEGSSGVPMWHLWARIENLRKGYHFLPVSKSDNFPQRVVSTEIIDLVHHVRREANFQLLILGLLLANVPLLPRSHTIYASFLPQMPPWYLDSVEQQLSVVHLECPLLDVDFKFLADHLPSNAPPQYLRNIAGQQEFYEFVNKLFNLAINNTSARQRIALGVWYLRFLRWLEKLSRLGRFDRINGRPKAKSMFKNFLKQEENRNVVLYYIEYALLEHENGDLTASTNTLETLASSHGAVLDQGQETLKNDLCRLHRILCEILISKNKMTEARTSLKKLCRTSSDEETTSKLKHVAVEVLTFEVSDNFEDMMLPCFGVDWIACYIWWLSLTECYEDAELFLRKAIMSSGSYVREQLNEVLVFMRRKFGAKGQHSDVNLAIEAISQYPVNATFAVTIAEAMVWGGGVWWKNSSHLLHAPITAGAILLVCAINERKKRHGEPDRRSSVLLKRLTSEEGKTSALLQRMYLRMLLDYQDLPALETARVLALEACPWNKSLYMEVIATSPSQLMPLTDLMVEKELRIHITPDEVDAMRD